MNREKEQNKLSQIIIYVDKCVKKDDICAFRTNMVNFCPQMWFTYLTNDEKITDLEKHFKVCKSNIFVITDNSVLGEYLWKNEIAHAGYYHPGNSEVKFRYALYCIENLSDLDFRHVERMWQRFLNIPWTITETKRLIIREQTLDDIDRLYEIYSDPDTTRYTEALYQEREDEIRYMKDYISNQYRFCEFGVWALEDKQTGTLVGRAGISLREEFDECELGYVLAREYRGKGITLEACKAILDYMKEEFDLGCVQALSVKENVASTRLLGRLGFDRVDSCELKGIKYERFILTY